jgi:hypothetical protein
MKILGMQIRPKHMSDAEYVESVRKVVARSKALLVLYVCNAVLLIGVNLGFWYVLQSLREIWPGIDEGLYAGILVGVVAGIGLTGAVSAIGSAIRYWCDGFRSERLMLKFHDELEATKAKLQQTDSGVSGSLPAPL